MTKPIDIIKHFLPNGTGIRGQSKHKPFPVWPPDMFAVCARLIEMSNAYTLLLEWPNVGANSNGRNNLEVLVQIGEIWREQGYLETNQSGGRFVQREWDKILNSTDSISTNVISTEDIVEWKLSALRLTIISDVACSGIGFLQVGSKSSSYASWIEVIYYGLNNSDFRSNIKTKTSYRSWYEAVYDLALAKVNETKGDWDNNTACIMVPSSIACVQPKTRTPSVGCTLRSVTHHLALLPADSQVKVKWHDPIISDNRNKPFNILFIPYPYSISGKDFTPGVTGNHKNYSVFDVNQSWLNPNSGDFPGSNIAQFVGNLVNEAGQYVDHVDMILMPELAMDVPTFDLVLEHLKLEYSQDNSFILVSGVKEETNGKVRNVAKSALIKGQLGVQADQRKHHRWKLDTNQIRTYSLADSLAVYDDWWENIDIGERKLNFIVFRQGACFATLICEDLARADPCQSVVRSLGPNLVIALLMDGPQINGRWPERYAMSLSDDPGCSVLSVTSLGLIERSNHFYGSNYREVGLWRDTEHGTSSICLPNGYHGVILNLSRKTIEERTLDGRGDRSTASLWTLNGKIPIKLKG